MSAVSVDWLETGLPPSDNPLLRARDYLGLAATAFVEAGRPMPADKRDVLTLAVLAVVQEEQKRGIDDLNQVFVKAVSRAGNLDPALADTSGITMNHWNTNARLAMSRIKDTSYRLNGRDYSDDYANSARRYVDVLDRLSEGKLYFIEKPQQAA